MNRCPTCNRIFTDQSLGFCIDDGTPLVRHQDAPDFESQPTAVLGQPPPTVQMPPPRPTEYAPGPSPIVPPPPAPYGWSNEAAQVWTPPPPPSIRQSKPQQGLALASLILGLVSITVGWCCSFGLVTSPIAIVLGIISLIQIKNNPTQHSGKPMAVTGIVTGILYFLFMALIILIYGLSFLTSGLG